LFTEVQQDFTTYLSRQSTTGCPDIGSCLYYYQADLGPTNIIVSEGGDIAGILDWESAGFYPGFWAGFLLNSIEGLNRVAWRDLLRSMLKKEGFEAVIFTL
jgi:hypothetical protein